MTGVCIKRNKSDCKSIYSVSEKRIHFLSHTNIKFLSLIIILINIRVL